MELMWSLARGLPAHICMPETEITDSPDILKMLFWFQFEFFQGDFLPFPENHG